MFEGFELKVELTSPEAKMPTRATSGDAGLDLYTPRLVTIPANGDLCFPIDIKVEFPKGYAMIVAEKSGVSTKKKLDIGAKIIDSGYRGICHVHLFNNSKYDVSFLAGEKVAQALVVPVWDGHPIVVDKVNMDTVRGEGAFGSTGK